MSYTYTKFLNNNQNLIYNSCSYNLTLYSLYCKISIYYFVNFIFYWVFGKFNNKQS